MQLLTPFLVALLAFLQLPDGGHALPSCQGVDTKFTRGPRVTSLNATAVEVSWHGLVDHAECAEDFYVQYGRKGYDYDYHLGHEWRDSPYLPTNVFSYVIKDLRPHSTHWFKVVATPLSSIADYTFHGSPKTFYPAPLDYAIEPIENSIREISVETDFDSMSTIKMVAIGVGTVA